MLTEAAHAFCGVLGAKIVLVGPADPEAKGLVERANGYLETSFLPGRRFASPADFNTQLEAWLSLVNRRHRRVLGCAPADRIDADRAGMLRLPPVAPATGWRSSLRLPRDHYVRLDANDYSVDPAVIGRRVQLTADLDRVQVHCDGRLVADHQRCWPGIRRSPTSTTPKRRHACAPNIAPSPSATSRPRSSCAAWPTTTPPLV